MTCGISLVWSFSLLPPPHTSRTPPSLHLPWSRGPAGTHASKRWVCECKWYRWMDVCRYSTREYLQRHKRTNQRIDALLV
ncbi:hypothetical protein COCVIDRAFT_34592 [Bipolaris victoriae FI3]|uniref:Uncharacterized protein n=1 Tax=Bipolaris victoriae (strain FI3) TaxID=930091 RepID=W7EJA3_BIPV3|nr:hypothetical protein COCVIDRAFT_34592 [Bipolaris victoriae FI3]